MKLFTQEYTSPQIGEGTFKNVFIEDTFFMPKRKDNHLTIGFEMYVEKDGEKIVIAEASIGFQGKNADAVNSNRTTLVSIVDPETSERVTVPMLAYLKENGGVLPVDYKIIDYGHPTQEDALVYFTGGTLKNPELKVLDPFAREWLKNTLAMKGEFMGVQFEFLD
jgi:hypothetical protein